MIKLDDKLSTDIYSIFELHKNNSEMRNFILLKAVEEMNELSAELTQKVLHPLKEDDSLIEDEFGDVLLRLSILINFYNKENIMKRFKTKLNKTLQIHFI
jgi:NTP pyrophosphatase (non-canonical NTP hydrolase)